VKVTLTDPASFRSDGSADANTTANNAILRAAIENTLSRDGTTPNQMLAPLDMNSQRIINLPKPVQASDAARLSDIGDAPVSSAVARADRLLADADVVLTHADVLLTHADVVLTHVDVVLTHADAASTSAALVSALKKASNLSDLANVATAKTNLSLVKGDVGLGNVDNTSDTEKNAATATLTNKSIAATQLTGSMQAGQFPALTGDVTTVAGVLATQLSAARRTLPTVQIFLSGTGTWNPAANCLWAEVLLVGGAAGNAGSGSASVGSGSAGGNTTLGGTLLVAGGGTNGAAGNSAGGAGGVPTFTAGPIILLATKGTSGSGAINGAGTYPPGIAGAPSSLGGAGKGGSANSIGTDPDANSGSSGGGSSGASGTLSGSIGGAGSTIRAIINSPTALAYAVGAGGSGGTAGTSGFVGIAGAAGQIVIVEHYN
jgi:hypothetical protein